MSPEGAYLPYEPKIVSQTSELDQSCGRAIVTRCFSGQPITRRRSMMPASSRGENTKG